MISFDYEHITKEAINEFNKIAKELPKNTMGVISTFLKPSIKDPNKKTITYLGDRYETWWSPKIIDWCKKNPGLHPDSNDYLSSNIITPFKKSIEIREGKDLEEALKYKLNKTFGDSIFDELDIDFTGIKNSTRFYTGVDEIMTGIAQLFEPIKKRKDISRQVTISTEIAEQKEQFVTILKIVHLNSPLTSNEIMHGNLETAKSKFTGYCDWQILGNYLDETLQFNILSISKEPAQMKLHEKVDGFTHKLIFY